MKISSQNDLILEIIKALKYNSSGIGLRQMYDVKIFRGPETSSIEFTPKEGREINPRDFFYLGLDIKY
ncbi:hypothetical protein [Chryseobacterium sp.]|uniref:hypothetical protein n=1 Tax=Chryseobacterium sp. TaxID=1871047 RepID=UPI0025C12BBE|nr:hypothetical protein [Chryseobacterium sp.]MBV8326631.1 hypothetical protein [Chryseobacterium sp.]